ncbi:MAG: Rieske 2Fe-2S domain-containing protein [bacterium]|nr:MAG: Rieske 2Fe-2S domain-containing protein [bacterium]
MADYLLGLLVLFVAVFSLYMTARFLQPHPHPRAYHAFFHPVASAQDVVPGSSMTFDYDDQQWILLSVDEELYAVSASCTFRGSRLRWDENKGYILCEGHGCVFAHNGNILRGLATRPLETLQIKIADGLVYALRGPS